MTVPISGVGNLPQLNLSAISQMQGENATASAEGISFQDLLTDSLTQVNQLQQQAESSIQAGLMGGDITQVEIFSSVKQADLAMRMLLQIRNQLLQAYNEIKEMRM